MTISIILLMYFHNYLTICKTFVTLNELAKLSTTVFSGGALYSMLPIYLLLCYLGTGHLSHSKSKQKLYVMYKIYLQRVELKQEYLHMVALNCLFGKKLANSKCI